MLVYLVVTKGVKNPSITGLCTISGNLRLEDEDFVLKKEVMCRYFKNNDALSTANESFHSKITTDKTTRPFL